MSIIKLYRKVLIAILQVTSILFLTSHQINAQDMNRKANDAKGLMVGDIVADFSAIDVNDKLFVLKDALKKGPVVVIFYRGQWCPICNRHLSNVQDSLQLIYDKGAKLIAISPEKIKYLKRTAEKTHASFSLLYDEDYKISNLFDVTFKPNRDARLKYNMFLGAKLKEAHSDQSERLPIPATFIIDTHGKIVWRHFNPDYKKRSNIVDIINHIPLNK